MSSFRIYKDNSEIIISSLQENVLGGNEALEFTSQLHDHLQKDVKIVIVDLSKVIMINSSGLGMLVSGLSSIKKHGASMVLTGVPEKVMSLLKMTHLDRVFQLSNSIEEAVRRI